MRAYDQRVFDPNAGDGNNMVVATYSDKGSWERELRDFNAERQEREIKSTMYQRTGVCG